ncbi:MAG: hypothetical protein C5B51_24330 [Terriglobia bacterium]|nr:MAG: hypothetical protein C5B51_24330 [Terriglobia bacterium]
MGVRLVRGSEITWRHLAATASIPFLFPSVSIDGRRYVDGGLLGALPVWAAEEMGAARVIAVQCLTGLPFRVLRSILPSRGVSPGLQVTFVVPSQPLGSIREALFWSRTNTERWIALGERDGEEALSSITM